jgi:hypothetical protein
LTQGAKGSRGKDKRQVSRIRGFKDSRVKDFNSKLKIQNSKFFVSPVLVFRQQIFISHWVLKI